MLEMIRPQLRRPGHTSHRPANQKPSRELREKENERVEEGNSKERLAPLRVKKMPPRLTPPRPTPSRPTIARLEKPRKKPKRKLQRGDVGTVPAGGMLLKSRAITATRRAIMPSIVPRQKTSDSLDDFQGPCRCVSYI